MENKELTLNEFIALLQQAVKALEGSGVTPDIGTPEKAPVETPEALKIPEIDVSSEEECFLEVGNCWMEYGVWGAQGLTQGVYTGLNGTAYEQETGVSAELGPNGEVTGRITWKFPTGKTEVKGFPAFVTGNKPGYQNSWVKPAGYPIYLMSGGQKMEYPSGKTPNSIFPLALPLKSLKSSFAYKHNVAPTERGHLTYDVWLQRTPEQEHGFNAKGEITTEIMIPLDFWGGYGQYKEGGGGRQPSWYSHDVWLQGLLWHVFHAAPAMFGQPWDFIVFEPDAPVSARTLDIADFIAHTTERGWTKGTEHCVSVELGVEPVDGTGDLTIYNHRVWKEEL